MKFFLKTGLFFIFMVFLVPNLAMGQFFDAENINVGKKAPDFTLKTLAGKDVTLTKFRDNKSAIVFFWATWCPHCREAMKELNQQSAHWEEKGIRLILIDLGEDPEDVRHYVEQHKIKSEVLLDIDSSLAESYGIIGVPTFYFLDKNGTIQAVEHELPKNYEEILFGKDVHNVGK